MSSIGSIYDDVPEGEGRGPDLRARVTVPTSSLGDPNGARVPLPPSLPHQGGEVERAPQPGESLDAVTLRLPEGFADGATLRLRGAGGRGPKGAGDLYLTVTLTDDAPTLPAVAPTQALDTEEGSVVPVVVVVGVAAVVAILYLFVL
ncbi:MAG: hypothetical protein AAGA54_22715 [Myxococcota bacterium]